MNGYRIAHLCETDPQYAVIAQPIGGSATMVCSVHASAAEANDERARQTQIRGSRWDFWTATVTEDATA